MNEEEVKRLSDLLDVRTLKLMERESELADRIEEIESQKEELTAAIEELVSKNKELMQRNAELDQLLYRTSHDLKTPVSSLEGILHILDKETLTAEVILYVEHIRKLNSKMNRVLSSLNRMRRAVLDPVQTSTVDLIKITNDVKSTIFHHLNYSQVQIQFSIKGSPVVPGDPELLLILLLELVSNAVTFRQDQRGSVNIEWVAEGNRLLLTVADDGEGISNATKDNIFEMFYRGSNLSQGSGMGLYIVNKLVDRLKGKIEWSSQPGLTIFKVTLPL